MKAIWRALLIAAPSLLCASVPAVAAPTNGRAQVVGAATDPRRETSEESDLTSRDEPGRPTVRAIRLSEALRLDGELDEDVFRTESPITHFIQQVPDEGAPSTERTEVWVMFDADSIYVAARCWDSAQEKQWVANDYRRDSFQMKQNDTFGLSFDTFYDRRNGFVFYTNPLGARVDYAVINETTNFDWDPVWDARPGRFDGGWTAEIAIPFRSLRYRPGNGQRWGIQLRRVVRRKNEWAYLARVPPWAAGPNGLTRVRYAGTLLGLELPSGATNIELKPYAVARMTTDLSTTPVSSNDPSGDFGVDAKYGVTSNLTADLTYNTDFAQVEIDEQQVNLTRFSIQLPEKRDFFLEGRGLFEFARGGGERTGDVVPTLFFSRRIGLEDGRAVPVTFGGRLTGKTGRLAIAMLNIHTGEEPTVDAPPTGFTVVRLKGDFLRRSSLGAIFTSRSTSISGNGSSQTYGADASLAFYDSLYMSGYYAQTSTPGSDGESTSYQANFTYNTDRYGAVLEHLYVGDDFNPQVGFVQRTDFRRTYASVRFSPRPRSVDWIRKLTFEGDLDYILSSAGTLETRVQRVLFSAELENSDTLTVEATNRYELLVRPFRVARGVTIPAGGYGFKDVQASYLVGAQRRANGLLSVQYGEFYSGRIIAVTLSSARVGVTPRLSFEPGGTISHVDLPEGRFTAALPRLRADYAFTPRMFASAFLQFNSSERRFSSNLRFRWEYKPGSELFVVYTDERDTASPGVSLRNRAFVIKLTRLFRL